MMPNDTINSAKIQETDLSESLFNRGLSIILEPYNLDSKTITSLDLNSSEKTLDLSDYLMPLHKEATTLTQLEPARPADGEQQHLLHSSFTMSECSMDSQSSSYSQSSGSVQNGKRKMENEPIKTPSKRGRKPASSQSGQRSKFGKHELITDDNKKTTLVFFGNKKVAVGTEEYDKRRKSNNDAVKKCREKAEKEQKEREFKMSQLVEMNKNLTQKVDTMKKEMNVLKEIIVSMRPDHKLPENIQKLINDV